MSGRCVIDQQGQQLRAAVVSAGVHLGLTPVNQREVEVGDDLAFTRAKRLADDLA
jgi:hypothetical protein